MIQNDFSGNSMKESHKTSVERFVSYADLAVLQTNQQMLWAETLAFLKQTLAADDVELTRCDDPLYAANRFNQIFERSLNEVVALSETDLAPENTPASFKYRGFLYSENLLIKDVGVISLLYGDPNPLNENDKELFRLVAGLAQSLNSRMEAESRAQVGGEAEDLVSNRTIVTEPVHTNEILKRNEHLFRLWFDASPIGIAICDREGKFLQFNSAFSTITAYNGDESTHAQDLFRPEGTKLLFNQLIAGEIESIQVEAGLKLADESDISLLLQGAKQDSEEMPILLQVIDITETKILEQRLRNTQKLEALGRLAGGVAHDFNNILTEISGYAELLAFTQGDADPQIRRDIEKIFIATARANDLTTELLAFSHQRVFQPKVVDVNKSISSVRTMFERLAGDSTTLRINLLDMPCLVDTDVGQLEQVILQLLMNARDAMSEGGDIVVWTDISTRRDGRNIVSLNVKDGGTGMDEATLERIFDPFFTTKNGGKGLGLTTAYGIINQSKGTIEVESALGQGSTFCIRMPQTLDPVVVSKSTDTKNKKSDIRNKTILLVEDRLELRNIAKRVLIRSGYDVLEAEDGPDAINCFGVAKSEGVAIDLLFTDILMPGGINGWELAQQLIARQADLQVLYTSGYTADAIPPSVNPENFLMKPYRPSLIVDTIDRMLSVSND